MTLIQSIKNIPTKLGNGIHFLGECATGGSVRRAILYRVPVVNLFVLTFRTNCFRKECPEYSEFNLACHKAADITKKVNELAKRNPSEKEAAIHTEELNKLKAEKTAAFNERIVRFKAYSASEHLKKNPLSNGEINGFRQTYVALVLAGIAAAIFLPILAGPLFFLAGISIGLDIALRYADRLKYEGIKTKAKPVPKQEAPPPVIKST